MNTAVPMIVPMIALKMVLVLVSAGIINKPRRLVMAPQLVPAPQLVLAIQLVMALQLVMAIQLVILQLVYGQHMVITRNQLLKLEALGGLKTPRIFEKFESFGEEVPKEKSKINNFFFHQNSPKIFNSLNNY